VKAGKTGPAHVRELRGTVASNDADLGVLITFQEPTKPMRQEAASAGFYSSPGWGTQHSRIQLVTVRELLDGHLLDYPHVTSRTFKKAAKASIASEALTLDLG
jgi:site-specific DNA-methyltransferase (adenine-specific)